MTNNSSIKFPWLLHTIKIRKQEQKLSLKPFKLIHQDVLILQNL